MVVTHSSTFKEMVEYLEIENMPFDDIVNQFALIFEEHDFDVIKYDIANGVVVAEQDEYIVQVFTSVFTVQIQRFGDDFNHTVKNCNMDFFEFILDNVQLIYEKYIYIWKNQEKKYGKLYLPK